MWDWDSLFMGIALLPFGSAQYLAGSMMNFLDHTDLQTGEVPGAFQATGPYSVLKHAKPIIIQVCILLPWHFRAPDTLHSTRVLRYWYGNCRAPGWSPST